MADAGVKSVPTRPFDDQRPGTSGLRKPVSTFQQRHYLENYVQSIFDSGALSRAAPLVIGGDGRYHSGPALQTVAKMAAANDFPVLLVGQGGLLSTPAASCVIRKRAAAGAILLTASHNRGGAGGDFGVTVNLANGGPAPNPIMQAIFAASPRIRSYRTMDQSDLNLERIGLTTLGHTRVEIFDPVADYAALMESLFDFDRLSRLLSGDRFRLRYDAMHAITGPYAQEILVRRLGAPCGSVVNGLPRPDFGGLQPDPNPTHARALLEAMFRSDAPDFGAASDGDGDRHMILGRGVFVTPSDGLAVMAANATAVPAYARGIAGIARSMPTSRAVDHVARALGVPCYVTPTGWKYFVALLDRGLINLCGEESFGAGSSHIREKDGLWAVLFWLSILAAREGDVARVMQSHWRQFGRHYYARLDYEDLPAQSAHGMMAALHGRLPTLEDRWIAGRRVLHAGDFRYVDPVDGTVSEHEGAQIVFADQSRIAYRLSGTGTKGATLRVYVERFEAHPARQAMTVGSALASLAAAARDIAEVEQWTGRSKPSLVT